MPILRSSLILLFCATTFAWSDELRTLGGKTIKGTVVGVNDKEVTLKTETGNVSTPLAEILALDLRPQVPVTGKYAEARLVDGSILRCSELALKGKDAFLKLLTGQEVKVPLDALVTYLHEAQDAALRKEWESLLSDRLKRDRILIKKEGDLTALECTCKDVDDKGETIEVRREGGQDLKVPLAKLQGIIFFRDAKAPDGIVCQVVDIQGNSLAAKEIAVAGDNFTVTTTGGIKLTYESKNIARFDYNIGKLAYLSDLALAKPPVRKSRAGVFDNFSDDIKKDVNLDNQPIMLNGQAFTKGLTLRAYTEVEYDLAGKYKKFKAVVGVIPPPESEQVGVFKPHVTIECDGKKRFSDFVTVKGTVPLDINVEGVTRLRIIVSSSNLLDLYDNATLADAKVTQ